MDNSVYNKAYELAKAIQDSPQGQEYRKIKEEVYADEYNKRMISDFKKMQFEAQAMILAGEEPSAEQMEKLRKLGDVLQFNPKITQFFAAEYAMQTMAGDVYRIIADACALDVPELQE